MSSLDEVIQSIGSLDQEAMQAARKRQDSLTKPLGSLGRLEELSVRIAGMAGSAIPRLDHKAIVVMAADHGVVAEAVTLYPQDVTPQMVDNFLQGGAAISVLARHIGARVVIVDVGVAADIPQHPDLVSRKIGRGTRNLARGPAMDRDEAARAIEVGIEIAEREIARGLDIIGTGDMGIGNTTASSAITAAILGEPVRSVTGRGTGLGDSQVAHKVSVIEQALSTNRPDGRDGLDVLSKVGGFEIAGLAGVMLGAAAHRVPVVIDGFVSGAAALIATTMAPALRHFLIAGHLSAERGHAAVLKHLGLKPVLEFGMHLGEGTGAALAISIAEAAVKLMAEMATFADAGVSEADRKAE
ncbi:MAG: nicotinate-nucleotide--dimethylbenzimidazole phosphoribosyltransferase [Chloroflexota bacterium]|nr:nicotinate-nucleotide--dimethylbenzimidazole phosphoribosyltransferase [Chloroflexota bacterium]